jgi:hypothetical protein
VLYQTIEVFRQRAPQPDAFGAELHSCGIQDARFRRRRSVRRWNDQPDDGVSGIAESGGGGCGDGELEKLTAGISGQDGPQAISVTTRAATPQDAEA